MKLTKTDLCRECPRYTERGLMGVGPKPCDVLFLSSAPSHTALYNHAVFSGKAGTVVRGALSDLAQLGGKYRNFTRYMAYSVRCGTSKIDKKSLDCCSPQVRQEIHAAAPKVIVPMGTDALKVLDIRTTISKVAGKEMTATLDGIQYKVLPTLNPYALVKEPGLYETFKLDLRHAIDYAFRATAVSTEDKIDKYSQAYTIPETTEDAIAMCKEIIAYTGKEGSDPDKWMIAIDTETNSLLPHAPTSKVIMVSFSWDAGKAGAIVIDHKDAPYDWAPVRPYLKQLIEGPKPKAFHNAKFDIKFIRERLGMQVNNLAWDTMLAEHLMDEAKKGYYGLKKLTIYYCPDFVGYENKIKQALRTTADFLNEAADTPKPPSGDSSSPSGLPEDPEERMAHYKAKGAPLRKRRGVLKRKKATDSDEYGELIAALVRIEAKYEAAKLALRERKKRAKLDRQKGEEKTFEDIPIQDLLVYASIDADITRRIAYAQVGKMSRKLYAVLKDYALPASLTLATMELNGFTVDKPWIDHLTEEFTKLRDLYEEEVYAIAGREFKIGSSKDLPTVLFMERGIPIVATSDKTGAPKADKETLSKLMVHPGVGEEDRKLCKAILNYRECDKAVSGFLEGKTGIRALSSIDNKIHTSFNINGTSTGRLSSSRPNAQNIPKYQHGINVKKLFIPDSPDHVVANMDYSGAELRALTAYAPDADLIKVLNNPEEDVHSLFTHRVSKATAKCSSDIIPYRDLILVRMRDDVASQVLSEKEFAHREKILPLQADYEEARRQTKRVVFGILYGMGAFRLSKDLGITEDESRALIAGLMSAFPTISQYIELTKQEVRKQGWVETKIGRRRRFPLHSMGSMYNAAAREAVNFKIQSTASDIVLGQLTEIGDHLHEIEGTLRITVHDSIVFTVPKSRLVDLRQFLDYWARDRIKERYPWLPVTMQYDLEVGPSYGEGCELNTYLQNLVTRSI